MGPPSRASSMRPPLDAPPRFPLMTPSASPPVHRPFSRQSATPAPAKKRRVSRAPSVPATNTRGFSVASASSSSVSPAFNFDASVDPAEELDAARRASSFRVLNVWSQLAEKYARRLDEDDIVDLEDGTIIKDCGILRSSEDTFEIGYFAKEQEDAERLEHDQPLTPADDEPDELDAFADIQDNVSRSETDGDEEDGLELAQHTKRLPPVRELDPADAADLAEFLRAEQLRRETFGDPDKEDEENETEGGDEGETEYSEEVDAQEEWDEDDGVSDFEAHPSGDEEEVIYRESVPESDGDKSRRRDYSRFSTPSGSPEFDILDLSHSEKDVEPVIDADTSAKEQPGAAFNVNSDDELGGWDHDEGSTLYSVANFSGDLADEGDGTVLKETSPYVSSNQSSKPRRKRSRASAEGKGRSDEQVADQRQSSSPLKKTGKQISPSPPVTQLQTPPRSASFGPEERNIRIMATYSRKGRRPSSSPRKAPMRIQSTVSESSASEAEGELSPSKKQKQKRYSPLPESPTKKMRLVPEVVINVPSPSPPKKHADESPDTSEHPTVDTTAARERRTKAKGKARAVDVDQSTSFNRRKEVELSSPPSDTLDPATPCLHSTRETARTVSSKKSPLPSSKRRRGNSPVPDESHENDRTVDVVMNSPSLSPVRSSSRRVSSSRRSTIREIESYDDHEPGPSSPKPQPSSSRRSRSRPSTEHIPEVQPQLHHLPELNTFSFAPPHAPHFGYQNYPPLHYSHSAGLSQQQHSAPAPQFQDPNAQYHLAQALQSLSILMGGALPFPPSPVHTPHTPQPPHFVPQGHHHAWPPYTPRHHNRAMNFDTPNSVASEPPPSSPLASDYSDSVPSSPTKRPFRERGRSQATSLSSKRDRPKSAIREARTRTRSRSRSSLRVSFSSPEATQIEDAAYEYVSDEVIEVKSSDEDSDIERRRLRREGLSKRSSELHVRAQTPGPPDHAAKTEFVEGGSRHPARRELGPKRKQSKASRSEEESRHQNGRGYR